VERRLCLVDLSTSPLHPFNSETRRNVVTQRSTPFPPALLAFSLFSALPPSDARSLCCHCSYFLSRQATGTCSPASSLPPFPPFDCRKDCTETALRRLSEVLCASFVARGPLVRTCHFSIYKLRKSESRYLFFQDAFHFSVAIFCLPLVVSEARALVLGRTKGSV
jgi:hypothetical protein